MYKRQDLSQDSWLFDPPKGLTSRPSFSKLPRQQHLQKAKRFLPKVGLALFLLGALQALRVTVVGGGVGYRLSPAWRQFIKVDAPRIQKQISKQNLGKGFTIRLSGSRVDLMQQSLDAYSRCSAVKEIQIQYRDSEQVPEVLLAHEMGKAEAVGAIATPAVLMLSQEVDLSCNEIERGKNALSFF